MNDTANLTQTKKKQVLAKTKYQAIVETSHDMVFLLKEKKITYANPSALKILGYFNDELIGKEASVLFLEKTKKNELLMLSKYRK